MSPCLAIDDNSRVAGLPFPCLISGRRRPFNVPCDQGPPRSDYLRGENPKPPIGFQWKCIQLGKNPSSSLFFVFFPSSRLLYFCGYFNTSFSITELCHVLIFNQVEKEMKAFSFMPLGSHWPPHSSGTPRIASFRPFAPAVPSAWSLRSAPIWVVCSLPSCKSPLTSERPSAIYKRAASPPPLAPQPPQAHSVFLLLSSRTCACLLEHEPQSFAVLFAAPSSAHGLVPGARQGLKC